VYSPKQVCSFLYPSAAKNFAQISIFVAHIILMA
jgi:hypothetical protein